MNDGNNSRRFKVMTISNENMLKLMTGEIRIKNIPEYTKLREAFPRDFSRCWGIVIEHPSFPEVPLGMECESFVLEIEETGKRNGRKLYFD